MERKQAIYEGDRSHEDLQFPYSLCLSYPGWENDFNTTIRYHEDGYDLGTYEKFSLIDKQNMHDGDRHPRLIALDSCAFQLNYPGWEKDAKGIEDQYVGYFSFCEGVTEKFNAMLSKLVRKQYKHSAGVDDLSTMHRVREIIQTKWSYDG